MTYVTEPTFRYVFGPVLSGRLGRSLGLDLLGARVCSMNCVYCESGPLKRLTLERRPYVPAEALRAELADWEAARARRGEPLPDVVTLGGMGEPTLNSDLPRIIADARAVLPGVPVAVLTNASLMTDAQVRAELALADQVLPSLDALPPDQFRRVNRGHPALDPQAVAQGILEFRKGYAGKLFLEVLLVRGVNDTPENLDALADYCGLLQPDRVDVTTLSRPGTEGWAQAVPGQTLALWRERLGATRAAAGAGLAPASEKRQEYARGGTREEMRARILATLARRPQTAPQLAAALCADEAQVCGILAELADQGLVEPVRRDSAGTGAGRDDAIFYQLRGQLRGQQRG